MSDWVLAGVREQDSREWLHTVDSSMAAHHQPPAFINIQLSPTGTAVRPHCLVMSCCKLGNDAACRVVSSACWWHTGADVPSGMMMLLNL